MAYQAPVPVPLPMYNWAASDQMQEFHLFKCQLETCTRIPKIKAEEKLDYLLCILGKEGYATMDSWDPADKMHKNDAAKFLDYIESTLDDEISPQVCVYELGDITKRSEESVDELVDWICQLGWRAQIGTGSDAAIEFEVQCRMIRVIPDANIELCKQLLKVSHDKRVSHLLEICRTYYAVESGVAAMCVGHNVHAVHHACQTHDPKPLTSYTLCPNCTHQHLMVDTTALLVTLHAKVLERRVTGEQNAEAATTLVHNHPIIHPISKIVKRGESHKLPKPKQRRNLHTRTCSLLQWTVEW